jgi:hypothetical protein
LLYLDILKKLKDLWEYNKSTVLSENL